MRKNRKKLIEKFRENAFQIKERAKLQVKKMKCKKKPINLTC